MADVERRFGEAMFAIYREARDIGYTPSIFLRMLHEKGALQTARQLINALQPSDGYTRLWKLERLDLSAEAVVHDNTEWHELFCPSSKQMGLLSVFHKGGSGSSLFDVKPLGVDGSSGGFGWSVF